MTHEQRRMFAKGVIDLANIGAGALVFGQLISGKPLDFGLIALGIVVTLTLYGSAYLLSHNLSAQ